MKPEASSLTLPLYLDDCATDRRLQRILSAEGHVITLPSDVGLSGADDEDHFAYIRANGLVLITSNPEDFIDLHDRSPDHPGIFLVYQDNDRSRDMSEEDIARAIRNLLASGVPIAGAYHVRVLANSPFIQVGQHLAAVATVRLGIHHPHPPRQTLRHQRRIPHPNRIPHQHHHRQRLRSRAAARCLSRIRRTRHNAAHCTRQLPPSGNVRSCQSAIPGP